MAKNPEPPELIIWNIYRAGAKLRPLGTVEAVDEAEAIRKSAAEFKTDTCTRWSGDDPHPEGRGRVTGITNLRSVIRVYSVR